MQVPLCCFIAYEDGFLTKNLFAYCSSSPVNNKDAKGTSTTSANFSMALCDSEAGGCRTKVSRPQRLEFDSMTAPATLNLYRDFGLRDDVDMPLLNETRYVTVMNNQEAKVISETLLKIRMIRCSSLVFSGLL